MPRPPFSVWAGFSWGIVDRYISVTLFGVSRDRQESPYIILEALDPFLCVHLCHPRWYGRSLPSHDRYISVTDVQVWSSLS